VCIPIFWGLVLKLTIAGRVTSGTRT
jgi:hypothetical protein